MESPDALFLWVPKCAGMSVYRALVPFGCIEERWDTPLEPFANRGIATFGHVDVLQLIDRGVVTQAYFDRAFKFAFVRNPFDRLVSLYFYLRRIASPDVPASLTFEAFCEKVERREHPPVGLYNYRGLNQCNPMVDWLTDRDGVEIADFVGRHETVVEDFRTICRRIGVDAVLPHENATPHAPYRDYYSPRTRAIVERVYRHDLDRFGYDF
jgi:hypothetical protein